MKRSSLGMWLTLVFVPFVASCALEGGGRGGGKVAIAVSPLTLDGIGDASYRITVTNGSLDTVWTRDVTSQRYGDGRGSLAYVGTCDASDNDNVITLELLALYDVGGGEVPVSSYVNPGPIAQEVTCTENADVEVTFDLTILRDARQGFFDVAVEFEDIFCSAKLDCVDDDNATLQLLHRPDGTRGPSAVLALACTGGDSADTTLYLSPVTVTCGTARADVDPTSGPGTLDEGIGYTQTGGAPLFGAAVYRGVDESAYAVRFWNVLLGLQGLANCRLTAQATAYDGALDDFTIPVGSVYPFISFAVDLSGASGERTCHHHGLDGGDEVSTIYATSAAPKVFDYSYGAGGVATNVTCGPGDPDSDSDGTPDCADGCPGDPGKIALGICGCGIADSDGDGDLTVDCLDGCVTDPTKVAPGLCGCDVSDANTDFDTQPDCLDGCPFDGGKLEPLVCGCGVEETNSDGDSAPDCVDECPVNSPKTAPGFCGCTVAETDSDGDTTPDCVDGCPNDPAKIAAGLCGCGVAESVCAPKLVFVTSGNFNANLGGVLGGDARCQNSANAAGIGNTAGRTFKAWLSDSTSSAATRLSHATTDYVRVDGALIAHGWNDLVDGSPIANTVSINEFGAPIGTVDIWSGTSSDGTTVSGYHCNNWTFTGTTPHQVTKGTTHLVDYWWGGWNGGGICNSSGRLLCFEQ